MKQFYLLPLSLILVSQGFSEETATLSAPAPVTVVLDKEKEPTPTITIANDKAEHSFNEEDYLEYRRSLSKKRAEAKAPVVVQEEEEMDQDLLLFGEEFKRASRSSVATQEENEEMDRDLLSYGEENEAMPQRKSLPQRPNRAAPAVQDGNAVVPQRKRATAQEQTNVAPQRKQLPQQPNRAAPVVQEESSVAPQRKQNKPDTLQQRKQTLQQSALEQSSREAPQQRKTLKVRPQIADDSGDDSGDGDDTTQPQPIPPANPQKRQQQKNANKAQVRPQVADDDDEGDQVPPPQPQPQPTPPSSYSQRPAPKRSAPAQKNAPRATQNKKSAAVSPSNRRVISQEQNNMPATPAATPTQKKAAALETEMQEAYNKQVRPLLRNGFDFWVLGEALIWQAVEDNLTYVAKNTISGSATQRDLKKPDFGWDWGFRVGIGTDFQRDGWDVGLTWLGIENQGNHGNTRIGDATSLTPIFDFLTFTGTTEAHAKWKVELNQVDLFLGREFFAGRHLAIRPNMGVRSAWIKQKFDVEYENTSSSQDNDFKNRFWGFGFSAGMNTDWRLGMGFSIFGNAAYSILMGFFDVDAHTSNTSSEISIDKSFRSGKSILDLAMGLQWSHLFGNRSWGLTFRGGYEYHLYFNQNQFFHGASTGYVPLNGDLAYQGATISMMVDF